MLLDDILLNLKKKSDDRAYTIRNSNYTYAEFYRFVCHIYHYLQQENENKKTVVVYGHKDVYMKAGFLACAFAGMPYVPIDNAMPVERVWRILEQVNPGLIIGDLKDSPCKIISRKQMDKWMSDTDYREINTIDMAPEDVYYILFTSGSSGIPKGVKVTYKNLDSCIRWLKEAVNLDKGVVLNQASFSFDLSVADLYLSLVTGSEHFILEDNHGFDFQDIYSQLQASHATAAVMTPSFADLLLLDKSFDRQLLPDLATVLFCGEKLCSSTVSKMYDRFGAVKIINSYGPTECTFAVTCLDIPQDITASDIIPVGKAKNDVEIFIVDEENTILSDGEIGEILITGDSVSDGYLGDADNSPFITFHGKRGYLTGDMGYLDKGMLYCTGRKDKQIKYKGYRIELADIENNLLLLGYIEKAVVVARTDRENRVSNIIAFIKLKHNTVRTELEIRKDIGMRLPAYMCPRIKIVNMFPINQNGKCDEKKLLEEYKIGGQNYPNH